MAAIAYAHALAGLEPPTSSKAVRVVLGGARRKIGTRPTQKAPATAERIATMLTSLSDTLTGKRDGALLALQCCSTLCHASELQEVFKA